MGWGNVDLDRMAELQGAKGIEHDAPELPDFPAGNAIYQFIGERPAAEDLVAIQALHDLYNHNLAELRTAYQGRERARIEREAWLKAHPQQPKNIILNYWRTEQPDAIGKGGIR